MGGAASMETSPTARQHALSTSSNHTPVVTPKSQAKKQSPTKSGQQEGSVTPPLTHSPKATAAATPTSRRNSTEETPKEEQKPPQFSTDQKEYEPTAIPVNGRMVYILGRQGNRLLIKYVPKNETKEIVVRCPASLAQTFIEHIDDYAFPGARMDTATPLLPPPFIPVVQVDPVPESELLRVELPPPHYASVFPELQVSAPAAAPPLPPVQPPVTTAPPASEEEALALAISLSLSVKDDPRNYDLSAPPSNTPRANGSARCADSESEHTPDADADVVMPTTMSAFDIDDDISHQLRQRSLSPLSASGSMPVTSQSVPPSCAALPPPTYSVALRMSEPMETERQYGTSPMSNNWQKKVHPGSNIYSAS